MGIVKDFEQRFQEEIVELLVLTKESVCGAAVCGNYLCPSLEFIASVDVKTGKLQREKGMLEWLIRKEPGQKGWGYDFRQFEIYHIRARKNIPVELQPYMSKAVNNCYMVVEVMSETISDPRLETIRERISEPVQIEEKGIGSFELDRSLSQFEGEIQWLGTTCGVFLETDEEDGETF